MHRLSQDGPPQTEVFRQTRIINASPRNLWVLLILCGFMQTANAYNFGCDPGFYLSSGVCVICPAGSRCPSATQTSPTACSSGQYSPAGSTACTSCPAGFYCSTTSSLPVPCDLRSGQYSTGSATTCSTISATSVTASSKTAPTTCASPNIRNALCPTCPAGSSCASGVATACSATQYKAFGAASCSGGTAGNFIVSSSFVQISCPSGMYSTSATTSCSLTPAGSQRTSATAISTCTSSQSALGAGVCSNPLTGYEILSSVTNSINMSPIPAGKYRATGITSSNCPAGSSCTASAATTCASTKYSEAQWGYCTKVPYGSYSASGIKTACTAGQKYVVSTSTCTTCTSLKCDTNSALTQTCQIGYYFVSTTCTVCTTGYICSDGIVRTAATAEQPSVFTANPSGGSVNGITGSYRVKCPAGYTCTTTTMTQNSAGTYSTAGQTQSLISSQNQEYNIARDLYNSNVAGSCSVANVLDGMQANPQFKCLLSNLGKNRFTATTEKTCSAGSLAWLGESCAAYSQNNEFNFPDDETATFSGVHCPSGWAVKSFTFQRNQCSSDRGFFNDWGKEYVKGVARDCPTGDEVGGDWSTNTVATHYTSTNNQNEAEQCQDCPPNLICEQYTSTYCYGKHPSYPVFDANNGNMQLHVDDRRVSQYQNQVCFDCNHEELASGSCVFASDYFPDHQRTSMTDNQYLIDQLLKCPFKSLDRTQSRYLDQIQWQRPDGGLYSWYGIAKSSSTTWWSKFPMQAATYSYQTYAWFDDSEGNIYPYSFCNIDESYFTDAQISSHSEFYDSTEQANTECTLYEYFSPNFPSCVPNYSGFISDATHDRPTETAVPNGYFTQLNQNDAYTGIKLMQCPQNTEWLMQEGGVNAYHTCHIKDLGSCIDSTSDYCNSGQDYMCPDGFSKKASGPYTNTINDCQSCGAGTVCSSTSTVTTCPDGYNCIAMTSDVYSNPGQPGDLLTRNTGTQNNDIATCSGANSYCPGATMTAETCPAGYSTSYTGASATGEHSAASCKPTPAGTYATAGTTCPTGKICPAGSSAADISIPPGYYSASSSLTSLNDATACPAGKFCASGSTTTGSDCSAGYFCPESTVFQYDTPCSFGSTSTAGATAATSCSACTNGNFCQEGSTAPLTDGSYCANANYKCTGGVIQRTACPTGQFTADGATCAACAAGYFCQAGVAPIACSAGYSSSGSLASCTLSTPGQVAAGGASVAAAANGLWTIAGQTTASACPPGYFCSGGTKTACTVGNVCAQGSSAVTAASAGTVKDETNLWWQKPCPAGYICPSGATRSLVVASQYTLQGDDGSTPKKCAGGYLCASGSIGPYQKACAAGTYFNPAGAITTCATCASGSYCIQGMQLTCQVGFYCDASTPAIRTQCPVGTYQATTGASTSACTPCDAGFACIQPGTSAAPTYKCGQGYFCILGATSTQPERIVGVTTSPTDDSYQCNPYYYDAAQTNTLAALVMSNGLTCNQGVCPQGYYCPEGTDWPVVCPLGTFNFNYGEVDISGCVACTEGYYCPDSLTIIACDAATVCPEGSSDQTSLPSVGHYSLGIYPAEVPCAAGTFQANTGTSSCTPCTAGSQCPVTGLSVVTVCDRGSDCSLAGVIVPKKCYYGQYLDPSNAVNPGCIDCPVDSFCWNDGIIEADILADNIMRLGLKTTGKCPSGYKCVSGADNPGQNQDYATNPNAYMCRKGYYCDNTLADVETLCLAGTYMPFTGAADVSQCISCKPGYECSTDGTTTPTACPSGFYCAEGTSVSVTQCQAGGYCKTTAEMEFACPYGSYTSAVGQTSCTSSDLGTYVNTIGSTTTNPCQVGFYCPIGSVAQIPCPEGQTSAANAGLITDCTNVDLGLYQQNPTIFGTITDGYFTSETGQSSPIPTKLGGGVCPSGSYCTGGLKTLCAAGTRCNLELTSTNVVAGVDECEAGFYCLAGCNRQRPTSLTAHFGAACPAKYYCPISSTTPTECPAGTYSDAIGLQDVAECNTCKSGYYCPTTAMNHAALVLCPAGYFCAEGISDATTAVICDYGKYCPIGSLEQIPCSSGYYQSAQGQATCASCEVGNYCLWLYTLETGLTTQKYTCPAGYQCPDATMGWPTPCAIGFYQSSTGQTSCLKCPAGYYCPTQAVTDYLAYPCPEQFYCPLGSSVPILCIDGQLCMAADVGSQLAFTTCPAGYYCISGIKYVCFAGYLCMGGAITPAPIDGSLGKLCDQGYWCAENALTQTECGIGYYQPYYGASDSSMCLVCPAGTSCPLAANIQYTYITCPAGYICDSTGNTPCDTGHYCPQGTLVMLQCPAGYYQDQTAQTSCLLCTETNYCNQIGMVTPVPCENGFYCPEGTSNYQTFRCPTGTYHLTTDGPLAASSDCTECEETYYCPNVAMTEADYVNFPCMDGFLCGAGSATATGTAECPKDHYCIDGIANLCPTGYYAPQTGLTSDAECTACSPGKICPNYSTGIYDCDAGYYCPGLVVDNSGRIDCPVGNYCPSGSGVPLMCEPGTYQDQTNQIECLECTVGNYCPTSGLSAPIACSTSYGYYYCPAGSVAPQKCPIGTYAAGDQQSCISCPAGQWCWPNDANDGIQSTECDYLSGYLCRSGSWSPQPLVQGLDYIQTGSNQFLTYNGPVKGGYISLSGGIAEACPIGTFQPSDYSQTCLDCYEGHYCPFVGMSDLTEYRCAAGYYCLKGNWLEEPPNDTIYSTGLDSSLVGTVIGGLCPATKECSYSLIHQMECEDGYISEEEGLAMCISCPTGTYCDITENNVAPVLCVTQSICNSAEKRQPICQIGTFMNSGAEYCQACPIGHYCRAGIVQDKCAAGYLCGTTGLTTTPAPAGTECPIGYYCPKGTEVPILCPFESQSVVSAARQATDCASCQPGYLCPFGARNATECPAGYYCPPQTRDIQQTKQYPCAAGTWNPWKKQVYQANCLDCTAGYYCNSTAIANITGLECPPGHYCPTGTIQPQPCRAGTFLNFFGGQSEDECEGCPLGMYCLQGATDAIECEDGSYCPYMSATMITCAGGFYCNSETRYQQVICPVNTYCPRGSAWPIPCDNKHTCPLGTETQIFCRNGYYVDTRPSAYGIQNSCIRCPIGTYSIADTVGCAPCPKGYLCYGGTNSNVPTDINYHNGEMCPKGAYCPEGSYEPELCPPGTYNQIMGAGSLSECPLCPAGSSNSLYGAQGCSPCGQFATSTEGSLYCKCIGSNRVYSPVDNSCRCRSGFDFYDTQKVSMGQSSDITDCIPIVFNRCAADQTRDPEGNCVQLNDCAAQCNGGNGTRDAVLGVCKCQSYNTTDQICNQDCRNSAPKLGFASSTSVKLTINNQTQIVDLTQVADVYGTANGTGAVKSVSIGSTGFVGSYGPSPLLQEAANLTNNPQTNSTGKPKRRLQTALQLSDQIPNPAYCIQQQDSFLFSIPDPYHYPVYMKDSVLNSNPNFDYGSFIDLATEMKRKQTQNLTTASMFTFTFKDRGNYIFQDAADKNSLMVIAVKGLGEKCADPDRYLQIISGDTLASYGMVQNADIIIEPNYPLIISMTILLFFGTGFSLWMVAYCMRKGWTIKELDLDNYREMQLAVNIHHENEKVFVDGNEFIQHKSELIDHQEDDDLDGCNFDIQQDLVDAGSQYLRKYEQTKQKHKRAKVLKKRQIDELLAEVESLVAILNSDSTAAQMHWLDLDVLQEGTQVDDNVIKFQIEKQMQAINKQEEAQNENYKQKKEELMKAANQRERLVHEQAHEKMLKYQQEKSKQLLQQDIDQQDVRQTAEYAIYDNGDVKSKNNQLVRKIDSNEVLNEEEKERLLQMHEAQLHNIDSMLETEKRKQEQELDRALKERLDRRHRLKDKMYGGQVHKETMHVEKTVADEFVAKKQQEFARLAQEHDNQVKEILTSSDLVLQRQQIQHLEDLTEQKKKQLAIDLEQQQLQEVEARKQAIQKKYLNPEQNEIELAGQLRILMGDQASQADAVLNQAMSEKAKQEALLKEKLANRQKKVQEETEKAAQKEIELIKHEDIIAAHEREVLATEAHLKLKEKSSNDQAGCLGLDAQGLPITDAKQVQAADVARKEAEERKEYIREVKFKMNQDIDASLQSQSLLAELEKTDAGIALLLKQQTEQQQQKLELRREQLRQRKIARVKATQNEKTIVQHIEDEELKQQENKTISEKYVRNVFKLQPRIITAEAKDQRMEVLNEYLSDQFIEELADLLTKQFMEKDASLKLVMHKYMEEGLQETTAIKQHFAIDFKSLELLRPSLGELKYNQMLKQLKLNEANLIKKTALQVQRIHSEEETKVRKELDRKHMQQQIEFRTNCIQRQAKLRTELVGETHLSEHEHEFERKALERFQQLKITEMERRIRGVELQKKTLTNKVDSELKGLYQDYDDMMRRKKQQKIDSESQEDSLRKRIQERKDRLKKDNVAREMTQQEQDAMLKNYLDQLSQLDSAYVAEQRRQQLIMKTKQENRKQRLIKVQQLKKELDKQQEPQPAKVTSAFALALRKKIFQMQDESRQDDDSELYRRLKEWNLHKRDYEQHKLAIQANQAGQVELDENQIKLMIIKLQQIEKLLKEVAKKKKQALNSEQTSKIKKKRGSFTSQSGFGNSPRLRADALKIEMIQEDQDSVESDDQQPLVRKQTKRA